MKVGDSLTAYRISMVFVHIFFTLWIFEVWGFKLKTFLFLTKINFFSNFFYFFYTSMIINRKSLRIVNTTEATAEEMSAKKTKREKFLNNVFKFSFCLSVAVNILYWSIILMAPSLLGNTPTPIALDLFLHGGNLLVIFFDYLLDHNSDKGNHGIGKSFLLKFSLVYFVMVYLAYLVLNVEVYPLISKLTFSQYSVVGVAGYGLFLVGHAVYEKVLVLK